MSARCCQRFDILQGRHQTHKLKLLLKTTKEAAETSHVVFKPQTLRPTCNLETLTAVVTSARLHVCNQSHLSHSNILPGHVADIPCGPFLRSINFHIINVVCGRIKMVILLKFFISDIEINRRVAAGGVGRRRREVSDPKCSVNTPSWVNPTESQQAPTIISPRPECLSTQLSLFSSLIGRRKDESRWKVWRGRNEGWESQRVSFRGGGRHYEHIYPKLEDNEERLKLSQYFRSSKWTTSPAGDNGPQRLPDTIMWHKWEEWQCESLFQDRGGNVNQVCSCSCLYIFL